MMSAMTERTEATERDGVDKVDGMDGADTSVVWQSDYREALQAEETGKVSCCEACRAEDEQEDDLDHPFPMLAEEAGHEVSDGWADVGDDDGDIVAAAVFVGEVDEACRDLGGAAALAECIADLGILNHVDEAVGAKEKEVAGDDVPNVRVNDNFGVGADASSHEVAAYIGFGFGPRHEAELDLFVHP